MIIVVILVIIGDKAGKHEKGACHFCCSGCGLLCQKRVNG